MTTTSPPTPDGGSAPGPISPAQLAEFEEANRRLRKISNAAKLAAFNGWAAAILAGISLLVAMLDLSVVGILAVVVLAVVAVNEFRGRRMLLRLDLRGPRELGLNQVGLMLAVIAYAVWQLVAALAGPNPYAAEIAAEPGLQGSLAPISEMVRTISVLVYASLIVLTLVFQGLNAWYYFTRARCIRSHLAQTPDWIVQLQRRSA